MKPKLGKAVVIGAGWGGLAVAIRLQARGFSTTLLERNSHVGGRANIFSEAGYTFDMGTSVITAPSLIDELFSLNQEKKEDFIKLVKTNPSYHIRFHDGSYFDYNPQPDAMRAEIERLCPGESSGYDKFLIAIQEIFRIGYKQLGDATFLHFRDMLKILPDLLRLQGYRSVYSFVSDFFSDERLRMIFSFQPTLIGGHPFRVSSVYSLIPALEIDEGNWYVMGGTNVLAKELAALFLRLGGEIKQPINVEKIITTDARVYGVLTSSHEFIPANLVVTNADVITTYQRHLDLDPTKIWGKYILPHYALSMSAYLLYLGLDKKYDQLRHHVVSFGKKYRENLDDIFSNRKLNDDFAYYLHAPSKTDDSVCPPGGETIYILVPVPHQTENIDWYQSGPTMRNKIIERLVKDMDMKDIREHIVVERSFTPDDFANTYEAWKGNAWSVEPVLWQSAWFRPHNRCPYYRNLYFVGAGTHPGAGFPGTVNSAKATERLIAQDFKLNDHRA